MEQNTQNNAINQRSTTIQSREHNTLPLILFKIINIILLILFGIIGILYSATQHFKNTIMDSRPGIKEVASVSWGGISLGWLSSLSRKDKAQIVERGLNLLRKDFYDLAETYEKSGAETVDEQTIRGMYVIVELLNNLCDELDKSREESEADRTVEQRRHSI